MSAYLLRVAPYSAAMPVIEYPALPGYPLGVSQSIPDVGVFGYDPERQLLPAAPDQDRDLTGGRRVEPGEPLVDDRHRRVEIPQPAPRRTERIAVLVVVPLEPP